MEVRVQVVLMPTDFESQFQSAVAAAIDGATVVTANTRAARAVLAECARHLRDRAHAWRTPDVLPQDAWIGRAWREVQLAGATGKVLLSPVQQRRLWELTLELSGSSRGLLQPAGVAMEAMEAWKLLRGYRIPLSAGQFHAIPEGREFVSWAENYEWQLAQRKGIDAVTAPDEIREVWTQSPELLPKRLVFWGFDRVTPQEQELRRWLASRGIQVEEFGVERDADWTKGRHVTLDDCADELQRAAAWARAKLVQNPAARIGVVVPGLEQVRAEVEQIFLSTLHPEFFGGVEGQRSFDISLGIPLSDYGIVRAALLTLKLAAGEVPFGELAELLRSPYAWGEGAETDEGARIANWLAGKVREQVTLNEALALTVTRDGRVLGGGAIRARLQGLAESVRANPPRAPMSEWTDRVQKILSAVHWPPSNVGGRPLDSAEYQTCEKWNDLLAALASLDIVVPQVPFPFAIAELLKQASATIFKPENIGAPVQVMGEMEAAGSWFDHLWVCGTTDEAWPARSRPNPFLPISLQRAAGIPESAYEGQMESSRAVFARLAQSAPEVIFSSPQREQDRELRPSPLLRNVPKINLDEIAQEAAPRWEKLQAGSELQETEDEFAPRIAPQDVTRRGTKLLELQSKCPFRAFAELRLGAARPEHPEAGLKATERGNIVERVLENVWRELRDSFTLQNPPGGEEHIALIIRAAVDRVLREFFPADDDPWTHRLGELERTRLIALMAEWLDVERRREPFVVIEHQQKVEWEIAGLKMNGRIDRFDRLDDGGFVVLDYKTGSTSYSPAGWKAPRPESPQLPIYVGALESQGKEVAGVAFAVVNRGDCALKGYATRKEILGSGRDNSREFEEQRATWVPEMERLAGDFLAGNAAVDPKRPPRYGRNSTCALCHLHALCRVAEQAIPGEEEVDDEQ